MSETLQPVAVANQQQNTPSIDDLNARLAEDARQQAAGEIPDDEVFKPEPRKKEYPKAAEAEPEVEEVHEEEPKEEPEEEKKEAKPPAKEEHKEDDDVLERIKRLAIERRETQRQLRAANEEIARLRGEKPPATQDEEFNRRVDEAAGAKAEAQRFLERTTKVRDAGFKEFSDFGTTLKELNDIGFLQNNIVAALLETDVPTKVLDYLGKNIDEGERIMALPPHAMGVALAKLSTKLTLPPPVKMQSKAPAPIKPVTGSAKATPNLEQISIDAFMKQEDERSAKRRRYS